MERLRKVFVKIVDFLGIFVPTISFAIIFITFMISIISRYILKTPVTWAYEISVLAYMWTMFFASGKALEVQEHVVFGLVYDGLSDEKKKFCRILYNVLLVILLTVSFKACTVSMLTKKSVTGVLKLPFKWIFAPFLFMFLDIIIRSAYEVYLEFKSNKKEEVK